LWQPNHKKKDCRKYKRDYAETEVANKAEQKGKNDGVVTDECEEGESYLIIEIMLQCCS
jgi:hypothetical protein